MGETVRVQNLFLTGVCSVYLIAFVSLFVQIPGLYGDNGILPVRLALNSGLSTIKDIFSTQPTLLHILPKLGIVEAEVGFNLICLTGIVLSFLTFIRQSLRNSWTFAALWLFYLSLFQVGQTFLWFQWDTLLLELGFLTIFVAPLRLPFVDAPRLTRHSRSITFWLVRWLTFRLMFCSGVVKLNSQCPTWWGLTATTFHYESQCIPTPLAWYAHQLPLWFHKASTASVFIIQIVSSILFFSPFRTHKIASFFLQSFLMVAILLTGNYNFFNYVSIIMCFSLVDDQFIRKWFRSKGHDNHKDSKLQKRSRISSFLMKVLKITVHLVVIGTIIYVSCHYFSIFFHFNPFQITSNIEFSLDDFHNFLHWFVPLTIWVASLSLFFTILYALYRSFKEEKTFYKKLMNALSTSVFALFAVLFFSLSLVPYTDTDSVTQEKLPPDFLRWHKNTQNFHMFNAYGLFRRMTGVGGRPEVIVEGSDDMERGWKEFNFLYKPGDVHGSPPFVAPHQPRLDWQMWFAALGSYNYNPWFYHLVYRVLTHQKEVLALMDKGPFESEPPKYIRAHLYHYHYTSWNDTTRSWWTREYKREYLPVISLDDEHLMSYVKKMNLYVDPDHESHDFTQRSLLYYFFRYLHVIAPPRHGCQICVVFLLVGIICSSLEGKMKEKPNQSSGGKQPRSVSGTSKATSGNQKSVKLN